MERCFNHNTFKGPVSVTNNQAIDSRHSKTTKVAKAEDNSEKKKDGKSNMAESSIRANRAIESSTYEKSKDSGKKKDAKKNPVLAQTSKNYTVHGDGRIEYCKASSFEKVDLRKKN